MAVAILFGDSTCRHVRLCGRLDRQLLPLADHTHVFVAGLTPPMGWRAWKAFYAHINQDIMEEMMVGWLLCLGMMVHLFPTHQYPGMRFNMHAVPATAVAAWLGLIVQLTEMHSA